MKIFSMKKSLRTLRGATDKKAIGSVWQQIRTEAAASVRIHPLSPFRRRGRQGATQLPGSPGCAVRRPYRSGTFSSPGGVLTEQLTISYRPGGHGRDRAVKLLKCAEKSCNFRTGDSRNRAETASRCHWGKCAKITKEETLSATDIKRFTSKPKSCSGTTVRAVSKQRSGTLKPTAAF